MFLTCAGAFAFAGTCGLLMAVLKQGDVALIVTSRSGPHFAPELFQAAGFNPFAASVLVAKSPCGFRAAYQARAAKIINLRSAGCAPADFWNCAYRNIPQPLWPWQEPVFSFQCSVKRAWTEH